MKLSSYNIVIPYKDNKYLLFNTISSAFALVDSSQYVSTNEDLIKGGFLVSDDCNELLLHQYRYLSSLFLSNKLNLTIATTMNCNFACPYCFEDGNKKGMAMQADVIDAINTFLSTKKNKPISITWFGGEPFLNWKAIDSISRFLIDNNIQFQSNAITNGSLLPKEIILKLDLYHIKWIQVTLDGPRNIHNKKRFYKNGKGSYDIIISNIGNVLKYSQCDVIIRVNLDKTNINDYSALKDEINQIFGQSIKNKRLRLWPNYVRDRTSFDICSNCLSPEEYYDFETTESDYRPKIPSIVGPCPFRSMSSFCIAPDGEIYKCWEQLGNHLHGVGNIVTGRLNLYRQADYALSALPFDNEKCVNCKILPICGGGCSIDARKNTLEDQNINLCPIEKERLNDILIQYYEKNYV